MAGEKFFENFLKNSHENFRENFIFDCFRAVFDDLSTSFTCFWPFSIVFWQFCKIHRLFCNCNIVTARIYHALLSLHFCQWTVITILNSGTHFCHWNLVCNFVTTLLSLIFLRILSLELCLWIFYLKFFSAFNLKTENTSFSLTKKTIFPSFCGF